jgi:hypothetical protein
MSQESENTIPTSSTSTSPAFSFENSLSTIVTSVTKQRNKGKNRGGRPKSLVWGIHAEQGMKIFDGHYEATCHYCNRFWHRGSPQDIESHLANDCSKIPTETRQFFLDRLAEKAESGATNLKKRKLNDGTSQSRITEFHESTKLSEERLHEINRACVKAFVICGIPWHTIENPFFIEFLKTLRPAYTPPSKDVLSGRLFGQEIAVVNKQIIQDLKNSLNLTLCKLI